MPFEFFLNIIFGNIINFTFNDFQYVISTLDAIIDFFNCQEHVVGGIISTDKKRMFNYTVFTQPVLMYLDYNSFEVQMYIRYMHTLNHVNPAEIVLDIETGCVIIQNIEYFNDPTHWWAGEAYDYIQWAHKNLPSYLDRGWFDEDEWVCGHWIAHTAHESIVESINSDWTKYTWSGSTFHLILQFPFELFPHFDFKFRCSDWYLQLIYDGVIPPFKPIKPYWEINYNFPPLPKPIEYEFRYDEDYFNGVEEKETLWRSFKYLIKTWVNDKIWDIKCWWENFWDKVEQHFRVKEDD